MLSHLKITVYKYTKVEKYWLDKYPALPVRCVASPNYTRRGERYDAVCVADPDDNGNDDLPWIAKLVALFELVAEDGTSISLAAILWYLPGHDPDHSCANFCSLPYLQLDSGWLDVLDTASIVPGSRRTVSLYQRQ